MTNLEIAGISLATLTVGICYLIAVFARGPLNLQIIPAPSVWKANPLVITRGPFGRASLSNLQLLFLFPNSSLAVGLRLGYDWKIDDDVGSRIGSVRH